MAAAMDSAPTCRRQQLAQHLRRPPPASAEPILLVSIKPHYARLIESGQKRVEFRRRVPRRFTSGRAIFYVTAPVQAIALTARVTAVHRGAPSALWRRFADVAGTEPRAFADYFAGAGEGVALVLEEVRALRSPIALADPRLRAVHFRPPQSPVLLPAAGDDDDQLFCKLSSWAGSSCLM